MLEPQSRHHVLSCEGECLGLNMPPFPWRAPAAPRALGPSVLRPTTQRPERQSLEAASWPSRLYSWVEHQDPWGFALESLPSLCPSRASLVPRAKQPHGVPRIPWPCWRAGVSVAGISNPNVFPCVPPPGLAGTCLLFPSRREQPVARQGLVGLMALPPRHKTRAWELPPGKASSTRCLNTRPKGGLLCNITLALVPPRPPWGLGRCRPSAAQSPLGPAWVPGLSVA